MQPIDRALSNLKNPSNPQVFVAPRYEIVGFKDGQPLLKPPGGEPFQGGKLVGNGSIQAGSIFTQQAGGTIQGWTMPRVVQPQIVQSPIDSLQLYFLLDRFSIYNQQPHGLRSTVYDLFKLVSSEGVTKLQKKGIRNIEYGFGSYCGSFRQEAGLSANKSLAEDSLLIHTSPPFQVESRNPYWNIVTNLIYVQNSSNYVPNLQLNKSHPLVSGAEGFVKPNDSIFQALNEISWNRKAAKCLIVFSIGSEEMGDRQSERSLVDLKRRADELGVQIIFVGVFDFARPWFGGVVRTSLQFLYPEKPPFSWANSDRVYDSLLGWNKLECLYFGTNWIRLAPRHNWLNVRHFRDGRSVTGWWKDDRRFVDGWFPSPGSNQPDETVQAFEQRMAQRESNLRTIRYEPLMSEIERAIDRANTRQTWTYNQYLDAFAEAWISTDFTTAPPPR